MPDRAYSPKCLEGVEGAFSEVSSPFLLGSAFIEDSSSPFKVYSHGVQLGPRRAPSARPFFLPLFTNVPEG
jgi:hypothetical protein